MHFAIIGHTGKNVDLGARGSNAILGDVDVMVTISGESIHTATVTKANDAPEGALFSFESEVFEFERDEGRRPRNRQYCEQRDNFVASCDKIR